MCSNNPQYEHECIKYINNLTIPEWYEIEIKVIRDAASITSGYNRGMLSSDAKYKIYLHQDTFIINKDFLNCLLKGFNDEATGMIGIIGTPQLDSSCVMWLGNRVGKLVSNCIYHTVKATIGEITSPTEVEAIDGLLMATQYDIPWREDIFITISPKALNSGKLDIRSWYFQLPSPGASMMMEYLSCLNTIKHVISLCRNIQTCSLANLYIYIAMTDAIYILSAIH